MPGAEAVGDHGWRHPSDTAGDLCRRASLLAETGTLGHAEVGSHGDVVAKAQRSHCGMSERLLASRSHTRCWGWRPQPSTLHASWVVVADPDYVRR